ncbi:metal-independent alpha-mannosidase [Paenibacillus sp. BIHB 4019]|uniref:Metal-independent alpha-mannosidase n=1 Tax=Paenibacillus sp. BIHB 4019 TaxID=1870819 RepID=A0A1B2DGV0_9BACL|nr:glycoside hydrolase family 125 protein [Paenibacillus sp. BIHB 4019]ANY66889.1 metal-independent alpha-mannosidase [Paenibacillus sp. BIHB 4019]
MTEVMETLPTSVQSLIQEVEGKLGSRTKLARMFANCFSNTLTTTLKPQPDGAIFVITGDIPAMWLRDSAAQVRPYLILANEDAEMARLIEGVVKRQIQHILQDPYANAFNEHANSKGHQNDLTEMTPWLWERKYEIDSLCYPIQLAYLLWKTTGTTAHFDEAFTEACFSILRVWRTEQNHDGQSSYRFQRTDCPQSDTLLNEGKGTPSAVTGMTWSGFRPSDDACDYGYLIPSNMFAIVVLDYMAEIAVEVLDNQELAKQAAALRQEIQAGIEQYATVEHEQFGKIFAYETDGLGAYNLMDDANVPSLLSLPYLGCCKLDDPIYLNTRRFVLSEGNPYYFTGTAAQGIGSPHTPENYIWHISLAMQALTSQDEAEVERLLNVLESTDAGTDFLHEGFHKDDPSEYTREWFSWANALFSELILTYCGFKVPSSMNARSI